MSLQDSDDGSVKKKRKRSMVSVACENCRSSHLKCDGTPRCGNCKRKNLNCTYSESKRRGRKPLTKDHHVAKVKKENQDQSNQDNWHQNKAESSGLPLHNGFSLHETSTSFALSMVQNPQPICVSGRFPHVAASLIYSPSSLQPNLVVFVEAYSYCHFLFPGIQIPNKYLNNINSSIDLHNVAFYAIVAVGMSTNNLYFWIVTDIYKGSLMTRDTQTSEENARYAHSHAKAIAFDHRCEFTIDIFTLLSYMSLVRGEKEKALIYNSYAASIGNAFDCPPSHSSLTISFINILLKKKDALKQLPTLINQKQSEEISLICSMYQFFTKECDCPPTYKDTFEYLDMLESRICAFAKTTNKAFESDMFKIMLQIVKAHVCMKRKKKEEALNHSNNTIHLIDNAQIGNTDSLKYYPYFFIKLLSKLANVFIEYNQLDKVEKVTAYLSKLPWEVPAKKTIETIRKKSSALTLLNTGFYMHPFKRKSILDLPTVPLPSLYQSQNLNTM